MLPSDTTGWFPPGSGNSRWKLLCVLLLLLAAAEFAWRGPARAIQTATGFNDFLSPYVQSEAWVLGLDPYRPQTLMDLWPADAAHFLFLPREVAEGTLVARRGIPTAYPVTALVLIAPFSLLKWKVAYGIWLALNLGLFAAMMCVLVELAGFSYVEVRAMMLVAAVLALAPIHTAIVTGNVTLVAVELSVIGIYAARRRYEVKAALLMAAAAGLKPQIGLCFILYYLVRRRWRVSLNALAALSGLAAIGICRLAIRHTPWFANYLTDNRVLLETGVLGNFTAMNPTRFGLINLQVALYPIIGGVGITNAVAEGLGAVLLLVWLGRAWSRSADDFELLDLSAIAVIGLLPVYHRFYDGALLVLPLCWAIAALRAKRRAAVLCLLTMLPFAVPGGTLLQAMEDSGRIPAQIATLWWWQAIVMAHQVWLLTMLSALLLHHMRKQSNTKVEVTGRSEVSGRAFPSRFPIK